jgi:uncharacterized protein YbjT (DUF2867 family)
VRQGAQTVISAIHGFSGTGDDSPRTVDWAGNRNLIQAAEVAGAKPFVLLSVQGAAPTYPLELFRMKYRAEQELKASGLVWTIIRPTAYMETWADLIEKPLFETGKTRIFGRGCNPINFVSVSDVARFVELAVIDSALGGQIVKVGGPENLTMEYFVQTFQSVTGRAGVIDHGPLLLMRAMAVLLRPVNPTLARQIQAGVVRETREMTFDPSDTRRRHPSIAPTHLAEVVRRDYPAYARALSQPREWGG